MKIGYLGSGAWGWCLANLLADNGHRVILWSSNKEVSERLDSSTKTSKLQNPKSKGSLHMTSLLEEAVTDVDMIVESVTSAGFRPVLEKILSIKPLDIPLVITSKGIEQNSGLLLSEVAIQMVGDHFKEKVGVLSGPSLAHEVMEKLPASVVCSAYNNALMLDIQEAFAVPYFRVYPNEDVIGTSFGGAMKNIMAIACGVSDGLCFGENTKAALMTRGLHEIRKLAQTKGCKPETLNGLSGMGDLCVTCLSQKSRNYVFGKLLAEGLRPNEAKEKIGMVVEGAYTCLSAYQLSQKENIPMPITEAVYSIIYHNVNPRHAVEALLMREIKEEHL